MKEDIFWPEGQWSIRKHKGEMVWSKTEGWIRYYEISGSDCRFKCSEDALKAWHDVASHE